MPSFELVILSVLVMPVKELKEVFIAICNMLLLNRTAI